MRAEVEAVLTSLVDDADLRERLVAGLGPFLPDAPAEAAHSHALAELERLRLALEGTREGVWDWDLTNDVVWYSDRWLGMLGFAPDAVPHTLDTFRRLVHPDDLDRVFSVVDAYLVGERPDYEVEFRMRHEDGHWVDVLSRGAATREDGRAVRLVGTHYDVSTRASLERELLGALEQVGAHANRMRALYDVTAAAGTQLEDQLSHALQVGTELLGCTQGILSHVAGQAYEIELAWAADGGAVPGTILQLRETYCDLTLAADDVVAFHEMGAEAESEHPCYAMLGLETYIGAPLFVDGVRYGTLNFSRQEARALPFDSFDRDVVRLLARWCASLLERREVERERQADRALLGATLESIGEAVLAVDLDGRVTGWNRRFMELWPMDLASLEGHGVDELVGQVVDLIKDPEAMGRSLVAVLKDPSVPRAGTIARHDGRQIDWQTEPQVLDGAVNGHVWSFRDVTHLHELNRLKDEFVSIVSHELRTPLTSIRGSLGLLGSGKMGELSQQAERMVGIATENSDRLVRLIDDVLDLERIEQGRMELAPRSVELARIAGHAIETMRGLAERREVVLASDVEAIELEADPDRLMQVLTNLLSNAIKFSPAGATVTLGGRLERGWVQITVRDEGRGIPESMLESIFGRFKQVDASDRRAHGGTGLGLAICRSIVNQHMGRIWVESVEGEGSTFQVQLPGLSRTEQVGQGVQELLPEGVRAVGARLDRMMAPEVGADRAGGLDERSLDEAE